MSTDRRLSELVAMLLGSAGPVNSQFFREVELKWGHPDDVVSGEGTFLHGNRFVPRGTHAVYASLTEETALQEYNYGQASAYGRFFKSKAVHITYPIDIRVERAVDIRPFVPDPKFRDVIVKVLEPGTHATSQKLGAELIGRGAQAIFYPSAVPGHSGTNIVCILDSTPRPYVRVANYDDVLDQLARIGGARRP